MDIKQLELARGYAGHISSVSVGYIGTQISGKLRISIAKLARHEVGKRRQTVEKTQIQIARAFLLITFNC